MISIYSLLLAPAWAVDDADDAGEHVVVTAYRFSDAPDDATVSTSVLDEEEIGNGRPTLEMGEALAQVPGVFVANRTNFAQDTRLSIRGFGSRSAFGIRGVRVILDGIPLTLPDGQSQIDTLDFANIGRMEVLRGPAGSLYGNAAGGVLVLQSKRAEQDFEGELSATVGSFGLLKNVIASRTQVGESEVALFASRTAMSGWREQSSVQHTVAQARLQVPLSDRVSWSGNVHYVRAPVADDPGGLTPEDFDAQPRSAASTNRDFGTGEDLSQLQIGTRFVVDPRPDHRLELVGHAGLRTFSGRIPFTVLGFDRDFYGALGLYRWQAGTGRLRSQLSAGIEWQGQQDSRRNEGNDGGLPSGEVVAHQDERVSSLGVFVQERLDITDRVIAMVSGRYDRVAFRLTDRLLADGDISGSRTFDQATGQAGVRVAVLDELSAFANVAQSFETPTLSELVNSSGDGGLDPDLRAQRALSGELGVQLQRDDLDVQAAAFVIGLDNELLRQEDDEGRAFFTNAGRSRRVGAELFARYQPLDFLELRGSYTWMRAEFREEERLGQQVPGLPEHRGFLRARVTQSGVHAAAEAEILSRLFADDANETTAPAYGLVGLRAGYLLTELDPLHVDLTLGVRNLLDADFADNTRINAFGDRYFEPGQPRHVYAQLTLSYGKK
ncbi:MAG: TonB-dependent receptor [Myxococcales bacterium]|nr:TonB-dependent receptor [Myxococcales bacterium]